MNEFFIEAQDKFSKAEDQHETLKLKYDQICDLFVVSKNDEKRQKHDKLFTYFTDFFDKVDKISKKKQ